MTTGPISDVAFDSSTYWATVGSRLYSSTDAFDTFSTDSDVSTTRAFGGLYYSDTLGKLYLAADGRIYSRTGGGWSGSSKITVDSKSVQFTTFVEISAPLSTDVYAGTKGYGYYTGSLVRSPSYTISALFDGAILSMLYDGSGAKPVLLLGTYNSGLWRGDWSGSTWEWKQE
jgi:hypothetical protein